MLPEGFFSPIEGQRGMRIGANREEWARAGTRYAYSATRPATASI